jgi:hypothetical protein
MNYILNNKSKFEKNRYNKPVIPPMPVILSRTLKTAPLPLPLKIDLPQYSYPHIPEYIIDFKLNNHSTHLNQIIKQINDPQLKPHFDEPTQLENIIYPYYNNELIINIYGFSTHLNTKILYEFLLELSKKIKIKIYIHTWNTKKNIIEYYFQGLNVVSIIIDQTTEFIDETETIFSSNISLSYWKLMWTSMYRSINEIYKKEDDKTIILNTRFDINYMFDINNLTNLRQTKFTKNIFLKDSTDLSGVDNPILGDKNTLYKLISTFYNNLDNVSMFYSSFTIPEASIYYENNRIFGVNYNDMFLNIEKYSKI